MRNLIIALSLAATACSWETPDCNSGDCNTNTVDTDQPTDGRPGADGAQGPAGVSFDAAQLRTVADPTAASAACGATGGSAIRFTYAGVAIAGDPLVACNGATGATGAQGIPGTPGRDGDGANPITMASASIFEGGYCGATDGTSITFYQAGVQLGTVIYVCNGETGPMGPRGYDGTDGADGQQGIQGERGATGAQGPRGYTGADGSSCSVSEFDGVCEMTCTDGTSASWECESAQPARAEICNGIDDDGDGYADESVAAVGGMYITMSDPLPGSFGQEAQPCFWTGMDDPSDPDTTIGNSLCATAGSWRIPTWGVPTVGEWTPVAYSRWEIGGYFSSPSDLVGTAIDNEFRSQGLGTEEDGDVLVLELRTPGDGIVCRTFEVWQLGWPATIYGQ
jgi:hypothetical protein